MKKTIKDIHLELEGFARFICSQGNLTNFGICVKDINRAVVYQNKGCLGRYEMDVGSICDKYCMNSHVNSSLDPVFKIGIDSNHHIQTESGTLEATHLYGSDFIITIYHDIDSSIPLKLDSFKNYSLTTSERKIVEHILKGHSSQKIIRDLFISNATLRTHLNNIYKKIPVPLKNYLIKLRGKRNSIS